MNKTAFTCGLALGLGMIASLHASNDAQAKNWAQWRGPTANSVALQGNPPVEWSEDKNVKWKVAIPGSGHATPIVWEDRIFLLTAVPTGKSATREQTSQQEEISEERDRNRERRGRRGSGSRGPRGSGRDQRPSQEYAFTVLCLDRKDGSVIWERVGRKEVPHEGLQPTNSYASGSPVTDGEHVIAFFSSRGLYCYDLEGTLVREKDLGNMRTRLGFGEGSSPALSGDTLVVL